jgi:hypothetical protein
MAEGKRPKKELTVNFINSQFACIGIVPGVTVETVKAQLAHGNYYLYEGEVKGLVEKLQSESDDFDAKSYVQFLQQVDALRKGEAPAFGGGKISLNSLETAKFVAANPENEAEVKEIMRLATILTDTRKAINPLLDKGVTCGIGFNSAARTKKQQAEAAEAEVPTAAGPDVEEVEDESAE